jgi:hypothetical protein
MNAATRTYVDPSTRPDWPGPIVMPVEVVLDSLTGLPRTLRGLLDSITRADYPGRVVGQLPPEVQRAAEVLMACASDFGELAQRHVDALSPEDRAAAWKTVKAARTAEYGKQEGADR